MLECIQCNCNCKVCFPQFWDTVAKKPKAMEFRKRKCKTDCQTNISLYKYDIIISGTSLFLIVTDLFHDLLPA
jgi:hypothetical protein